MLCRIAYQESDKLLQHCLSALKRLTHVVKLNEMLPPFSSLEICESACSRGLKLRICLTYTAPLLDRKKTT